MRNTSRELKDTWIDFESVMQMSELKKTAASDSYFAYVAGVASYEKNGEFGLTDALAALIDKCGLYGAVIEGEMFDIGNEKAYKDAIRHFA
jgi:UTP-glucose-1-phosphate uridylyltransferase